MEKNKTNNMSKKIKRIIEKMITEGEFEKLINSKEISMKEKKHIQRYYDSLLYVLKSGIVRGIDDISITPLLIEMPRMVLLDVITFLILDK